MRETVACIVCRKPSDGYIATGHVKMERTGDEILATFCSEKCRSKEPPSDIKGCYGQFQRWMGIQGER